ncbi:MAG: formate dehydrogenase accessory protein FdhE [Bacillota bacterium]
MNRQESEQFLNNLVALWQDLARCEVRGIPLVRRIPTKEERKKWEAGMPWLLLIPPVIAEELFFSLVHCVAATAKEVLPELAPDISQACDSLSEDPSVQAALLNRLRERVFHKAGSTQEVGIPDTGVSPELKGFLIGTALKLYMREYAKEAAGWFTAADWQRGICPVCGNYPSFSVLRDEERARYLYCDLCGTNWRFHRIGCPFCEVSNGEQTLLVLEERPEYRIYVCESCRGYLKTLDTKVRKLDDLLVENIRTSFLDVLLLREGYCNPALEWSNVIPLAERPKYSAVTGN